MLNITTALKSLNLRINTQVMQTETPVFVYKYSILFSILNPPQNKTKQNTHTIITYLDACMRIVAWSSDACILKVFTHCIDDSIQTILCFAGEL